MKVSVIVPIYKVERFIGRCAESLMRQTMEDAEFIFVNDATPDESMSVLMDVLKKFPQRKEHVVLLDHEHNKGLPSARNTGMAMASGDYIYYCDSDDFADEEMLEKMYTVAKTQDADIVWCDWFLSYEKKERYMRQPSYDNPLEAMKAMLCGSMKYNVWNKLVRRSLYLDNGITFPAGYGMGEDMTMIMLFSCAKKVSYLHGAYYHYVKQNTNAFSQTYSNRHILDLQYNVERVASYLRKKFGLCLEGELMSFKLDAKFPFLITDNRKRYETWASLFPEANSYIWKNHNVSLRTNIVQWAASKKLYWFLAIYYKMVYKILYNSIFK